MNDDQKLSNMSEGEFRDLEDAPLQNTPADNANDAANATSLNDDALENSIDADILNADLDDPTPIDLDADLPKGELVNGEGFTEVLESDMDEELSDWRPVAQPHSRARYERARHTGRNRHRGHGRRRLGRNRHFPPTPCSTRWKIEFVGARRPRPYETPKP